MSDFEDVPLLNDKVTYNPSSILDLKLKDALSGKPINITQFLRGPDWSDDFNPYVDQTRRKALLELIAKGVLVIDDSEVQEVEMEQVEEEGIEMTSIKEGEEGLRQRRGAVVQA